MVSSHLVSDASNHRHLIVRKVMVYAESNRQLETVGLENEAIRPCIQKRRAALPQLNTLEKCAGVPS